MPFEWPSTLVQRIVGGQWVLFLGSGVSMSCINSAGTSPPGWSGLLTTLCQLIRDEQSRAVGTSLIEGYDYLGAADHIQYSLDQEGNVGAYQQAIRAAVDGPANDRFEPSELIETLLSLEPGVVFTTNYDKIFEVAARNGFAVHPYSSTNLLDDLRLGEPVYVKLHGSTDAIQDIVLTRTDYASITRKGRDVFKALDALSATSTILFVGYSLDDPDIQLVLQAVGRSGMSPEAHFMLAPEPASPSRVPVFRESFGVSILTYQSGEHLAVTEALKELSGQVLLSRERLVSFNAS